MYDRTALPLPVAGEIGDATWDRIAEGQPVLLLRNGRPAAVIIDLESWEEAEEARRPAGVTRLRAGVCRRCSRWTMVTEGICGRCWRIARLCPGQLELFLVDSASHMGAWRDVADRGLDRVARDAPVGGPGRRREELSDRAGVAAGAADGAAENLDDVIHPTVRALPPGSALPGAAARPHCAPRALNQGRRKWCRTGCSW